ncbi:MULTISPECIES: hypothetical protein [Alistipes]
MALLKEFRKASLEADR